MSDRDLTLEDFANCPRRRPAECCFGPSPDLVIDTGHSLAPRVSIWKCEACGHGVTRPAMADVSPLYAGRESEDFLARDAGWVGKLKERVLSSLARELLRWCRVPPDMVADFGTGNGMLARCLARQATTGTDVVALDFFEDAPGDISPARYLPFSQAQQLSQKVDLLTCFHVLEHNDDPHAMVDRLIGLVRPGGTMIVEVPNVDCVWTPWFGEACANWYAPYHRVHFSRTSLTDLMTEHRLEIVAQQDICGPTFALSLAAFMGVRPTAILFALAVALRPFQWLAEKMTKRPSALRVIVRIPTSPPRSEESTQTS